MKKQKIKNIKKFLIQRNGKKIPWDKIKCSFIAALTEGLNGASCVSWLSKVA